jgi:hypothetical protein
VKTEDLIKQLASEAKPVSPLKGNPYRFSLLMVLNFFVVLCGLLYWYLKKDEIHFPLGRSFWEILFIFMGIVITGWNMTTSVSPHSVRIKINKLGILFLAGWISILLGAFFLFFSENPNEAVMALKYKTWLCPQVIFSVAIPSAIFSLIYLRKGEILYPAATFFYWALTSLALGVFALSFICPWNDPLHELLWHVLPVLMGVLFLAKLGSIVFGRPRGRWWIQIHSPTKKI